MSDRFDVLERFAPLFDAPDAAFERFERRRDRKRRHQRIAASAVAASVIVAAVALVTASPFDRGDTPAVPRPAVTPDPGSGPILLPPEGATPSAPERGELIVSFYGRPASTASFHTGVLQILVYADGRMIWRREGGPSGVNGINTGFFELRVGPEGVNRLRYEITSSGLFDRDRRFELAWDRHSPSVEGLKWGQIRIDEGGRIVSVWWQPWREGDPMTPAQATALRGLNDLFSDLAPMWPGEAWDGSAVEAYVPSRYAVCYQAEGGAGNREASVPSEVVPLLPAPAQDVLLGKDRMYEPFGARRPEICSEVTIDDARILDQLLDDSGFEHDSTPGGLTTEAPQFLIPAPAPGEPSYVLRFEPILPHGQWSYFPG